MKKLKNFLSSFKFPKKAELKSAFSLFSKKEWYIFGTLILILTVTTILVVRSVNNYFMTNVPMSGGSISEGIVGTPRFVNPVLAISDADRDLTSLVYSGLMRKNIDGSLVPDLAESYEISKDGLTYTFTLKDNIFFHDKEKVTADDVLFTINTIKDPLTKSPKKGSWDGIGVEKIDDKTIKFILKQPYTAFLENTTIGIIPEHIWTGSHIELNEANTNPIGSGPYEITSSSKNSSGMVTKYSLSAFKKFTLGKPYIKKITLRFYSNEDDLVSALESGEVDQASSISAVNAEILKDKKFNIISSPLPRVFGLFFNPNQAQVFTDKNVIKAINLAVDKDKIVREVLDGYGVVIDDPIPPNMMAYQRLSSDNETSHEEQIKKAQEILAKDGWTKNEEGFLVKTTTDKKKKTSSQTLAFTISTGNAPELSKAAELIQTDLSTLGIQVEVKTFEIGNLNQTVIRPRQYDALLFGQIINHESDLFAFWHSSQRKDPGLNVAMYTNAKVDKILEEAFVTMNDQARMKKYAQFEEEVKKDMPAVFLYSPSFIYVISKNLQGVSIDHIASPSDRFLNSYSWYVNTDKVWKIFAR
ncbi:MAG TPA: ABC transporter substrate-binding protein [Candidatus Paceibacterota bacterium]|nr:ABC transporter substrate-binding protein [Candidatus Paceibacterota bacterium]